MGTSNAGRFRAVVSAALAVVATGLGSAALAQDSTVQATWTPKQLRFLYQGFTTKYTCDGLRDRIRSTLLLLGARKDLQVTASGCFEGFGRPSPFPGVWVNMNVLQPVDGKTAAGAHPVTASWKRVDLATRPDPLDTAGDCELMEQVKQSFLPLFTTRDIDYSSRCVPHQLSVGGITLKAEVLITDQSAKAPATAAK